MRQVMFHPNRPRCGRSNGFSNLSRILAGISIIACGALAGCGLIGRSLIRASRDTPSRPAVSIQQHMRNDTPLSRLSPFLNGPGVVICNPVASAGLSDFGQGAGGWLNVAVAGQPQFSRTPALGNLERACREMGSPALAVESPERADRLAAMLGVSEVAIGTLTGTEAHCKLTYRLLKLAHNRPIGTPITAEGTTDQIAAQLPAMATKMAKMLGAAHPDIPAATGLSAANLQFLGPISLSDDIWSLTDAQKADLRSLAPQSTFAAILALRSIRYTPSATGAAADVLLSGAPSNSLAVSEVGWDDAAALVPHTGLVQKDISRFPENYLFALSSVWIYRSTAQPLQERKAAETTMQCAPASPDAWLTLGYSISNEADEIRQGRYTGEMSDADQQFVNGLYPDWAFCSQRATQLDPFYGKAWLRLATASCFDGDPATADSAFWQAARLDPDKADVYEWGLQMYQPKWRSGDPQKLNRVAQMAASGNYATQNEIQRMASALGDAGCTDAKAALLAKYPGN